MSSNERAPGSLYAGDDLHQAAERTSIDRTVGQSRLHGLRNAAAIAFDLGARRLRRQSVPGLQLLVAIGEDAESGREVSVAYAGHGENLDWCLSTALEQHQVIQHIAPGNDSQLRQSLARLDDADILFLEGISPHSVDHGKHSFVVMPAWIKQRIPLQKHWHAQVDGLRRTTRQEVRRFLRKYRYESHLSTEPVHFAHFYDGLYIPYVTRRFGATAKIVGREFFLRECRRGVLLRLTREGTVLGAALLRRAGNTMAVVWSALDIGRDASLPGVTDTLDYFSLLYAQMTGCDWLDLGPSRPDLCDGILRYKAKWGARITPGLVPQPTIAWTCKDGHGSELHLLRRHAFLRRTRSGLQVVIVPGSDTSALLASVTAGVQSGVRDFQIVAAPGTEALLADSLGGVDAKLSFPRSAEYPDFMSALCAAGAEG